MFYEFEHDEGGEYFIKTYNKNFSYPPHLHNSFELIIALSGELTITIDGKKEIINKGDGVLIFPNQLHSISSTDSEDIICIFSPEIVNTFTSKTKNISCF